MVRSGYPIAVALLGCLCAPGATVPQDAAAAPLAPAIDARALGATEAVFDYCSTNDPPGAAKVRARIERLMLGASKEALAQARGSGEYRSAHEAELGFVAKVDPHNAHRICSQAAAPER